ncbi:MAG: ATP synthase F1 subunit gamma [Candidatus Bostrichicola ureolyticus]|nr:MAG: ATP synthase F1 subunit gamma [Candidatus Bostrichicola ureolyticus]
MLKDIKIRINSILSIIKITNAMKLIAASKLKKVQTDISNMQQYEKNINKIYDSFESKKFCNFLYDKSLKKLLIVISSNRGFCGSFNSSIIKETLKIINTNVVLLTIGTKCKNFFLDKKFFIYKDLSKILNLNLNFKNVSIIVDNLLKEFYDGNFNCIELIYNKNKKIIKKQFLPICEIKKELNNSYSIFEPSSNKILNYIITLKLKITFLKVLLESSASEHTERMIAMHQAKENALNLKFKLELIYNKARQTNITKEILEIISGL